MTAMREDSTTLPLTSINNGVQLIKTETEENEEGTKESLLLYGVDDVPPWYICLLLGMQHYLEMIGASVVIPFFLAPAICMADEDPDKGNLVSALVFTSGIITILQTTFGSRLPIVQGGSYSYLIPCLAIMKLPQWQCPAPDVFATLSSENRTEVWQVRMREIQGAIMCASLFEVLFAATGIIGLLSKRITPLTVAPALSSIGISLFKEATAEASKNWPVAISTLVLFVLFSQYLRNIKIRACCQKIKSARTSKGFPLFQVFPVLLSVGIMWTVCSILTVTDLLPEGDPARSDAKLKILKGGPWFRIPYPFQWGWPTVSLGAFLGILCGVMTSSVESLGDYYACATIARRPAPPMHAVNRGIFMEGLGCFLSGVWGSGNGSTSYSSNIGTLSITRVASRRVIQVAGLLMIVFGLSGKAGGAVLSLPDPIMAGLFLYIFPIIIVIALGTLEDVSLSSARNLFILGFSMFTGLSVSQWAANNPGVIQTGDETADGILQILLSTGMFISGLLGFVLDNSVPGSNKERGITRRLEAEEAARLAGDTTYDLPFGMDTIRRCHLLRWIPLSPTFNQQELPVLSSNASRLMDDRGYYGLAQVEDLPNT